MNDSIFIKRVTIKNYKSIAACDVRLGPLMFLVGPNGAGKSNFLDALRFVADALNSSLDHAIRDRGGINDVRRRSGGHPNHFSIRLDFALPMALQDITLSVSAPVRSAEDMRFNGKSVFFRTQNCLPLRHTSMFTLALSLRQA